MATFTKTFTFASSTDGWTYTVSGTGSFAWSGTDGNPSGSLAFSCSGKNKSGVITATWNGTFLTLGLPANSIITGYSLCSYDRRCSTYTTGLSSSFGTMTVNDGISRNLITGQTFTGTTAWTNASVNPGISGLSIPVATSVTFTLIGNVATGNSTTASTILGADNISITIAYNLITSRYYFIS